MKYGVIDYTIMNSGKTIISQTLLFKYTGFQILFRAESALGKNKGEGTKYLKSQMTLRTIQLVGDRAGASVIGYWCTVHSTVKTKVVALTQESAVSCKHPWNYSRPTH